MKIVYKDLVCRCRYRQKSPAGPARQKLAACHWTDSSLRLAVLASITFKLNTVTMCTGAAEEL